jgi:mevalonate pyrophosphate decarboxylase
MVNMIFVLGIHRKKQKLNSDDLVQLECAKRTFWQAYMLDKYLACSLGRPPMLRDEDIDQDLPKMVNDEDLLPATLITTSSSVQRGSVYHIK